MDFCEMFKNVRNRLQIEFIKNCENEKFTKEQSKSSFNGFHESYTFYSIYTFRQNEVVMGKPMYVGLF